MKWNFFPLHADDSSQLCYRKLLSSCSERSKNLMAHAAAMSCGAALAGVQHLPEVYTWFSHGLEWRSLNQGGSGAGAADMKYLHCYIIHKRTCVCALSHWWGLQLLNVYMIFWRPSNNKSGWVWREGVWVVRGWGSGGTSSLHVSSITRPS